MKSIALFLLLVCNAVYCFGVPMIEVKGKKTVNFGTFPANKMQSAVFTIKNTGDENLKIIRIRKTCACATGKLSREIITPGETATLTAYIKKNSIAGQFSKNIYVESNAGNSRFLSLTLSGKAIPLIRVSPKKYLYLGTLSPGKANSYSFTLKATQPDVKLKLMPEQVNIPVKTSLQKLNDKEFSLLVIVTPDKANELLDVKITVNVLLPKGWPSVEIKLMGKTSDKAPEQ